MKSRLLSLLMVLVMLMTCIPAATGLASQNSALEQEETEVVSIQENASVKSVKISGSHTVTRGKKIQLKAKVNPSSVSQKVTWSSSNAKVAKVNTSGKVTGVKAGTCVITAKSKADTSKKATWKITVVENVTKVSITGDRKVKAGETIKLKATVSPSTVNQEVTWSTSNKKIATVTSAGKVKGVSGGTCYITATSKADTTKKAKVKITVTATATSITITGASMVTIGKTIRLKAKVKPTTVSQEVTWQSSDEKIATVSEKGVVTGISSGKVTITATSKLESKVKKTWKVTVTETVEGIEVTGSSNVAVGYEVQLSAAMTPPTASKKVSWSSSNEKVATVSSTGLVKGVKAGKAEITAKSLADASVKATIKMTVYEDAVTDITLNTELVRLYLDGENTFKLEATASPSTAAQIFTWKTDDKTIATVDEKGKVTAVGAGETTVYAIATDGSYTQGSVTVKVYDFSLEEYAKDFVYQDNNDGTCYITGYTGNNTEIIIPRMDPDGREVVGIGSKTTFSYVYIKGVFSGNTNIVSVTFQEPLAWIGASTFQGCTRLKSVFIPDSVTTIYYQAFSGCTALKSLDIPGSVTTVCQYAFLGCTALDTLVIGDGVTSIDSEAFAGCTALTEVFIPGSVENLGVAFCNCTRLKSVTLSEGVSNISGAFKGCISLPTIDIPSTVTDMSAAFSGCISLKSANIAEGVSSIGNNAFNGCKNLKSILIPSSAIAVRSSAFYNCTTLSEAVMLEGVTQIDSQAFNGCTSLKRVEIPSSVVTIGEKAFLYCTNLSDVAIPEGVTTIEYNAFEGCSNLQSIHIPSSVVTIGQAAFAYSGLKRVTMDEGIITLSGGNFSSCKNLVYVQLPESLVQIGNSIFSGCENLTEVHCPSGSNAWNYVLEQGLKPVDTGSEKKEVTFSAAFDQESKTLYLGDSWIVEGTVSVNEGYLGKVTVNSGDLSGSSMTDDFKDHDFTSIELADWAAYTIDTTKAPWNVPGEYTLRVWAKDENGYGGTEVLDTMTLIIKESITIDPDSSLEEMFDALAKVLPSGKYWNHHTDKDGNLLANTKSVTVKSVNGDTMETWISTEPCPSGHHSWEYFSAVFSKENFIKSTCNAFMKQGSGLGEAQCIGFANTIAWAIGGKNPISTSWSTDKTELNDIAPGDMIWISSSSSYGHKFVVLSIADNMVKYVDCNGDGHCIINWDRTMTMDTLRSKFLRIKHYEDYKK